MNGRYTSTSTSYYYEWKITGLEYWTPECKNEENTSTYALHFQKIPNRIWVTNKIKTYKIKTSLCPFNNPADANQKLL